MSDTKCRPGFMVYFDAVRPALSRLDNEQSGALFRAIVDYAEYGEVSELDPMAGMAFDILRPKLDRDSERYEEVKYRKQYAVHVREAKKKGVVVPTFEEWKTQNVGSPSPSPFDPSASPFPNDDVFEDAADDVDTDVDAGAGADTVDDVVGYHALSPDNTRRSQEDYFEKKRNEAIAKLKLRR